MERSAWDVLDWRRQVSEIYRAVRQEPDPAVAHATWVAARGRLLLTHPASPVPAAARADVSGAAVAPYDARFQRPVVLRRGPVCSGHGQGRGPGR